MAGNKIKILHLQKELNITCGITKTIQLIIKHSTSQFDHHVMTFGGDGFERFSDLGITPSVINYDQNSIIASFKFFLQLYRFIKKNNINIVHSHHRYFDLQSFFVSKILNIRTLTSVQSKVDKHKRLSYKSKILIAVSETIKNHLITEFLIDESRIRVINNFIDPQELLTNSELSFNRDNIGLSDDNFIVTFVGRFSKEKGIDVLLKAISKIQLKYKKVILLMIGAGEEKDQIENYIHVNNLNAIILPPAEKIFKYYKNSNVIVLPSRNDPFPMVMLEAGLFNKPFIGSEVDGIAEFIEDGVDGFLFEPDNAVDLAEKIKFVLNHPSDIKIAAEALHKKVIKYYTAAKILPKYEKLYSDLINA